MKNLKQIQEENRKAIICAVHDTDDYDEALERENKEGCRVIINGDLATIVFKSIGFYFSYKKDKNNSVQYYGNKTEDTFKIIGKPLTLDRVLLVLGQPDRIEPYLAIVRMGGVEPYVMFDNKVFWNLTKQTLEEQDEKTQRVINELLTKEN